MSVQSIGFGPLKGPDYGVASSGAGYSRLVNGCISTVAATLPSFIARLQGDLHSIPPIAPATTAKHYVAVGQNGTVFSDDFNRVNSSLIGRNWVRAGGNFSILGNKLHSTDASAALLQNFGRVDQDITVQLLAGQGGPIAWTTTTNGTTTGYRVEVNLTNTGTNCVLFKTNAQIAAGHAGTSGVGLSSSALVTLSVRGTTIKVLVNYLEVLSYEDTGTQPGGAYSGIATGPAGTYDFDNVTLQTPGTLKWVPIGGAELSTAPPPAVNYDSSIKGATERVAREDHTHLSIQFAYDYLVVP